VTRRRLLFVAAAAHGLVCAACARADVWAGSTATSGLDLPASALVAVAGTAAAGLVSDASAVLVNPARLAATGRAGVAATYTAWPAGVTDGGVAAVLQWPGMGTGGVALRALSADVPVAPDGDGLFEPGTGTTPYRVVEGALGLSPDLTNLSADLPFPVEAGAALLMKHQDLAGRPVTGVGATVSLTLRVSPAVSLHAAGRDLGTTRGVVWPMTGSAGITWTKIDAWLDGDRMVVAGSGEFSRETGAGGGAVVEYGLARSGMGAALRVGEHLTLARSASVLPSAGLVLRVAGVTLELAVMPFGTLGTAQIVSLSYTGESPDER